MASQELSQSCGVKGLSELVRQGAAFHNSDLDAPTRKMIERLFVEGDLKLMTATSTLAMGVNLPATRVIFRSCTFGGRFLTPNDYRQMSGRAGRTSLCDRGDAVLIVASDAQLRQAEAMLAAQAER